MRTTGPFSQYNRYIAMRKNEPQIPAQLELHKSMLGLSGAGEARFLVSFVEWAKADGTTYT